MFFGIDSELLGEAIDDWRLEQFFLTRNDWESAKATVEDVENDGAEFASWFVETRYEDRPTMGPVGTPDNSASNISLAIGIATAVLSLGLFAFSAEFAALSFVSILPVIFWVAMSRGLRTAPETHFRLMEREFEEQVRRWDNNRDAFQKELALQISRFFWIWRANQEGVPERLWDKYASWVIEQIGTIRTLKADLEEWAAQPEFPPPPLAVPEGVSHEQYEDYCRQVLVSWGYTDAKTSRYVRDGGIDVECQGLVVQCKHIKGSVRAPEVQAIFGIAASKGKKAVVFSAGSFTKDAINFSNSAGVALVQLTEIEGRPKLLNDFAYEVAERKTKKV